METQITTGSGKTATKTIAMSYEQIKMLGAPFDVAEIHVSLKSKVARYMFIIPNWNPPYPAQDLELLNPGEEPFHDCREAGMHIIEAMRQLGLLHERSKVAVVDVDIPAQA
ncbi:MAG: hypothetical protein WBM24_17410 [Candidatus Sulfotelmatobacter sp.]|jgi:hypothetical protein